MRRSLALAARARFVGVALCGISLAPAAACHQRWDPAPRPSSPDRSAAGPGGAAQSVSADELKTLRARRVEELLAGRVPGVQVLPTPGGGFAVRIRGTDALPGYREPLYVVDGLAIEVLPGRGLDWLDPADIARIEVLKDAAELTYYGGRGANGVVVITTKRGRAARPR